MARNEFKGVAEQFGKKYRPGTKLLGTTILTTVREIHEGNNGFTRDRVLGPQLAIEDDEKKQINAIVLRLNKGFEDAAEKLHVTKPDVRKLEFVVETLDDFRITEASPQRMYERQVSAALSAEKALDNLHKVDREGLPAERKIAYDMRDETGTRAVQRQKAVAEETGNDLTMTMYKSLGVDEATCRKLIAARAELDPLYATQRKLSR